MNTDEILKCIWIVLKCLQNIRENLYNCQLCDMWFCKGCLTLKGENKSGSVVNMSFFSPVTIFADKCQMKWQIHIFALMRIKRHLTNKHLFRSKRNNHHYNCLFKVPSFYSFIKNKFIPNLKKMKLLKIISI